MAAQSRVLVALATALVTSSFAPRSAVAGPTQSECVGNADKVQLLREEKRLRRARTYAIACAQDGCPSVVRKDCADWLAEIDAATPSVVVRAKNKDGGDVTSVRLSIDGSIVSLSLDGSAIPLDPGQHIFRVETTGAEPIEKSMLVAEGERARVIELSFAAPKSEAPPPKVVEAPRPAVEKASGPGPLPYAVGAVGVLGVGAFVGLQIAAQSRYSDMKDNCAVRSACSSTDVDSTKKSFTLSGIALGVGIAGLAGAAALFLLAPHDEAATAAPRKPGVALDVTPAPGGGYGVVRGAF